MNEDPIIFTVEFTEDEIQSFAEPNFGRKLTEDEIKNFENCIWDDDKVFFAKIELLAEAIEAVMNYED